MAGSLERARAAKAELAAKRWEHRCPSCDADVVTHIPCQVWHWCPAKDRKVLTGFVITKTPKG